MSDRQLTRLLRLVGYVLIVAIPLVVWFGIVVAKAGAADWRTFLDAVREEESAGNDRAVGDGGRSRGPYQCGRAAWTDACEYGGVSWDYDRWVWDRGRSEQVLKWYVARYDARTWQARARVWNGGPRGCRKQATLRYWRRVKARMDRSER